jgi:hypothetical protein
LTANMSWQAFWCIFKGLEDGQKVDTFNQNFRGLIGWTDFVKSQTPRNQCEVLDGAPVDLIRTLKPVLSDEAKYKLLGIEPTKRRKQNG